MWARHGVSYGRHVIDHSRVTSLYVAGGGKLVALEVDFMATTPPGGDRKKDRDDFAIAKLSPTAVTELGNVRYIWDAKGAGWDL
jgi:hypothetical protein